MMKMPTAFQQAVLIEMDGRATFNEKTGRLRYYDTGNDIWAAISDLGGVEISANLLNVSTEEIDLWIDEYFVPDMYAEKIHHLIKYSITSLQQPHVYTVVYDTYWPKSGFMTEMNLIARERKNEGSKKINGGNIGGNNK